VRARRYIRSNRPYEICLRTRVGLPFPIWSLMCLLLWSALARTQRDYKVTICQLIWLSNHLHLLIVGHDAEQVAKFLMELQKKITDSIKRLTGIKHLNLWDGRPIVAEILDKEELVKRLTYFYVNPADANLVKSITDYPGISTWDLLGKADTISYSFEKQVPWIRLPMIQKLPSYTITETQDKFLTEKLTKSASKSHELIIKPNAWMKCFDVDEAEVKELNDSVKKAVFAEEAKLDALRILNKRSVMGAARLRKQGFTWAHEPKKRNRRIYVLSSDADARIDYIRNFQHLTEVCRSLYREACAGARNLMWPPGFFTPRIPPLVCAIGDW